jgi:hypothetical protein
VLTADLPQLALAKQIQWNWPDAFGESKFVLMFGGQHIEMAALKVVVRLSRGSGWTSLLVPAGVTTSGVADSMLCATHIKRT